MGSTSDRGGRFLLDPSTSFLYTGREFDSETGLYYNRARFYDPQLGRFITTDPKGYEAGLNLYTYTRNNPLSFNDPLGLDVGCSGGGYYYGGFWGAVSSAASSISHAISSAVSAVSSAVSSIASSVASTVASVASSVARAVTGSSSSALPKGAGIEIAPGANQGKGSPTEPQGPNEVLPPGGIDIKGPPSGPEGASRFGVCGTCGGRDSGGGQQPSSPLPGSNEVFRPSIEIPGPLGLPPINFGGSFAVAGGAAVLAPAPSVPIPALGTLTRGPVSFNEVFPEPVNFLGPNSPFPGSPVSTDVLKWTPGKGARIGFLIFRFIIQLLFGKGGRDPRNPDWPVKDETRITQSYDDPRRK